jgi:hypothetical protein
MKIKCWKKKEGDRWWRVNLQLTFFQFHDLIKTGCMDKVDRFQEGEATQLPFGRLTPITYLPFLLSRPQLAGMAAVIDFLAGN